MSAGVGGGYQSGKSSTTGAGFPYMTQLAGAAVPNLANIMKGGATQQGMQAITNLSNQQMTTGVQNLKNAFAGSGMGQSSDMMRGISQYQQQSQLGLQASLAQFAQTGIQDQLAAIGEWISLGQGTSITHQSGWDISGGVGTPGAVKVG